MNCCWYRALSLLLVVGSLTMGSMAFQGSDSEAFELRTPWGDPDLQGFWNNNTVVPLERPEVFAARESLTGEEIAARFEQTAEFIFAEREGDTGFYNEFWFEYGRDTDRTSLIIDPADGRLPSLTLRGKARDTAGAHRFPDGSQLISSWEDLTLADRCLTRGLPGTMSPGFGYNHNYQILQTANYLVVRAELIHDTRVIPLDGRSHIDVGIRQWLGDSRGRWEGATLVVETKNFSGEVDTRLPTVFGGSDQLILVERFTRVSEDTIDYRYTFSDPTEFTQPWTAAIPMHKVDGPIYEYACHEGNYALPGILSGARSLELQSRGTR